MNGDLYAAWDVLSVLIVMGFTIGVVVAIIVGAIRIGWQLAPWLFFGALLIWFFGG